MKTLSQKDAPLYEALEEHRQSRMVHLDVPGTKADAATKNCGSFWGAVVWRRMSIP